MHVHYVPSRILEVLREHGLEYGIVVRMLAEAPAAG